MKTISRKRAKVKKKTTAAKKKSTSKRKVAKKVTRKPPVAKASKPAKKKKKAVSKPAKKAVSKPAKKKAGKKTAKKTKLSKKRLKKRKLSKKTLPSDNTRLNEIDRVTEMVRQFRPLFSGTPYVPRPGPKKGTRKIINQRGPLRDLIQKQLNKPMAKAQMIERLEEKLPPKFFEAPDDWVETEESLIIQRLAQAEQLGVFDEEARENALEFDWDLRDVYELWHSPEVYF